MMYIDKKPSVIGTEGGAGGLADIMRQEGPPPIY